MNFPLKQLEQHVEESALLAGERLFEQQKVRHLQELEKHLWIATVDDDYEIELQITPSKVQNATCECSDFLDHGQCQHIVAGLFALRQKLQAQQAKRKKQRQKKSNSPPKRLTPSVILDNVTLDELTDFVRKYASRDRNFALALKARFAGVVEFHDTKEKYLQVLDSSIEAARKTDRMISYRGARKLEKVLNELLQQAETALAQKHLTTTLYIAESIIEKVTPILRKVEREKDLILERLSDAFELFHTVLESDPAPALQNEIWSYAQNEATKLTYRLNGLTMNLYRILRRMATTPGKVEELLYLLNELLDSSHTDAQMYVQLLLAKLSLLEAHNRHEEAQVVVQQNLQQPEILHFALRQLLQREEWEAARKLAEEGLRLTENPEVRGKLEDILLQVAQQQDNTTAQATYARRRLLTTLQMDYFHTFKKAINGVWQPTRTALLDELQQGARSLEKRNLVAAIYAAEGMENELFDYIQRARSLDLLQK